MNAMMAAPAARGVEAQIYEAVQSFEEGWNRHDMEACFSSYADDADFVNVLGQWWRGRDEIVRQHAVRHEGRFRDSVLRTTSVSIRFLAPSVAVLHVGWELTGDLGADGQGAPTRKGILQKVMCRYAGRWQVELAQNTDQVQIR